MSKVTVYCDWCGKPIEKYLCVVHPHNFCCREHLAKYSSKTANPEGYDSLKSYERMSENMSKLNAELNPTRMTDQTRAKIRDAHFGTGHTNCYAKLYGKHEHRQVAAQMLGRELLPGEVVHHIDGNKRNNSPENLMVFSSQAEHARYHKRLKGGDHHDHV